MKVYLVGGAVRDQMLGLPVHERDWVVVGSSPQQLVAQGYEAVGKDFPVFLHPTTKEEYALARTERKTAPGYSGFECYAAPDVTLEQDLVRRDLTINAMAMDENGNLYDPYNGKRDLEQKHLRHVSDAFCEDPVRILRLARFAARFHHLGFTVAPETHLLMEAMVEGGEVDHLVPERIWKETSRALLEHSPAIFFQTLRNCGALQRIMPEIDNLFGIPQRADYHPEIDTGVHTLMALTQASLLSESLSVRFATLLHDLGKAQTPVDVLPSHHGHELRSLPLVKQLCKRLAVPTYERDLALAVAQYHTHCHKIVELKPATLVDTLKALDAFRRPDRFEQFLLCCEADARGRTGFEQRNYASKYYFSAAFSACREINPKQLMAEGYSNAELGEQIRLKRIEAVKTMKDNWQANQS